MAQNSFNPIIPVKDDGLAIPEVRGWSNMKYNLVGRYCQVFTTAMRHRWENLVYIDLFAGAGYAKIKETGEILRSSAMIALSTPHKFTKYIFCEENKDLMESLKRRVKRDFQDANVVFIAGDCNENAAMIEKVIPSFSPSNKVLSFCFADPFSLNLKFETIKTLASARLMDFLILQALHMDGNRNFINYYSTKNRKVDEYLGLNNWRETFNEQGLSESDFVKFLADKYCEQMVSLNYLKPEFHQIKTGRNLPLYYLAFFSKHERGRDFFKKVEKYSSGQGSFDF